jgi:hypothetical protein
MGSMVIIGRIDGRMDRHDEVIGLISQMALRIEHYSCSSNDNHNEQLLFA